MKTIPGTRFYPPMNACRGDPVGRPFVQIGGFLPSVQPQALFLDTARLRGTAHGARGSARGALCLRSMFKYPCHQLEMKGAQFAPIMPQ